MKFLIQRDQLINSVQHVLKAVSARTTIPILTGIKITATAEGVTLTGSDSDISIESFIPAEENDQIYAEIKQPGSIVLQAKFFGEIVKKLPETYVEIEVLDQFQTFIKSGSVEFLLNGLDPDEYPLLPQLSEQYTIQLQVNLLKEIIRQTVFAVSTQETRPILTGVHWKVENNELICTATDSHRLSMRKAPIEKSSEAELPISNIVIPGKSLNELSKILDDTTSTISVVLTENQILFKTDKILFYSRLLEGNYPDTSRLIPTDSKTELIVPVKEFLHAIDRALLLARESRNNVVKLAMLEDSFIEISTNIPEIGKVAEQVQSKKINGEEISISFSAKYMMDALKVVDATEVKINFTGAMRPFLIQTLENENLVQLILPVRTF